MQTFEDKQVWINIITKEIIIQCQCLAANEGSSLTSTSVASEVYICSVVFMQVDHLIAV